MQEFLTVRVCNCCRVFTTAISQYDGNQWWIVLQAACSKACVHRLCKHYSRCALVSVKLWLPMYM